MKHITEVLVHSNRCEVVNGHTFTVGDTGLAHIKLKFLYLFESESLEGKTLECKYILPNKEYSLENVIISSKDEIIFPIHYSCFSQSGWTTLKITLVDNDNRFTLQDIVIKCNALELGSKFLHTKIETAINEELRNITANIEATGETIKVEAKQEIDSYIENNFRTLRGEQGDSLEFQWRGTELGVKTSSQSEYNFINLKGEKGERGETGSQGLGIRNISTLNDNQIRIEYSNNKNAIIDLPIITQNLDSFNTRIDDLNTKIETKEAAITTKNTGFNLNKTDSFNEDDTNKLGTARALKRLFDEITRRIGAIQLTWDRITGKPNVSSSVTSNSEIDLANSKAVKTANDNANSKVPKQAYTTSADTHYDGLSLKWSSSGNRPSGLVGVPVILEFGKGTNYTNEILGDFKGNLYLRGRDNTTTDGWKKFVFEDDMTNVMYKNISQTMTENLTVRGTIYCNNGVRSTSDKRLKSNIKKIDNALEKVNAISGYTFEMNGKRNAGVIAQEIEKVLPEVIEKYEDGYLSVAYGNIVGLLIEAIKELKQEVEGLKNESSINSRA